MSGATQFNVTLGFGNGLGTGLNAVFERHGSLYHEVERILITP